MILIDTNLLVYATIGDMPAHEASALWFNTQLSSAMRVGLPWHSLLGCIRLVSNRAMFTRGPSVDEMWKVVRSWLARDNVWIPSPTARHGDIIDTLMQNSLVTSKGVMDVHLAALAIEHGLTLCSADQDFARYRGLDWRNPLASTR